VVAISGFTIGPEADFGNTWYNDHHFHYGYLILAASILSHLDESWGITNDPWITALVRDVANPSDVDPHFPVFRAFDWYVGHSWAKGIFPSADGKDEESTSEDVNFYYSMKLYGLTSKRKKVTKLANMMLAILRRSIRNYFLLEDGNQNHPSQFSGNKVTGILFENKVDYATYFSPKIECIHGIQMLPATPITPYTRSRNFITQEWKQKLVAIVNSASDSWKSIL
ncbi:17744_t:CDS:2, partial [Acaulospora morrowiae]